MKVYVFGNHDVEIDNKAVFLAKKIEQILPKIQFVYQDPNEDFDPDEKNLVILDTAVGVDRVEVIEDLDNIKLTKSVSMHDFDIGFKLKLLKKLSKVEDIKIIVIPSGKWGKATISQVIAILQSM